MIYLRKLSDEELDQISVIAVNAAENYIFSRISKKEILDININVELEYEEGLDVDILVDLELDSLSSADKNITQKAVDHALAAVDALINKI